MASAVEPSNVQAEEHVLGACFLSANALDVTAELLETGHFYREGHGAIFGAMLSLRRRNEPIEPLILAGELERLGILDKVGGNSRLQVLAASATSASNVAHYAALVLEAARSRSVYRAALAVQQASLNGGLSMHPELIDEMQRAMDEARILPGEPGIPEGPVFLSAHEFAASRAKPPDPLLGTSEMAVIAAGGLTVLAGRPGTGKTTLVLDLACHLAAGIPWPPADASGKAPAPWPCPRPLKVALIVNEGPQTMFQAKVEDKLERFPHSIREAGGGVFIQAWRWGAFSFADRDAFARAQLALEELEIDLVIGDPLLSMGPEGVGSPRETSDFVQLLRPLGLGMHRAFLFLHHFRERRERTEDELASISGAWGGHLDTLLTLAPAAQKDQARLAYPKLRWATGETPNPVILGRVYNTRSFEALGEEGDAAMLEPVIAKYLAESRAHNRHGRAGWQKVDEIATGLEARQFAVRKSLEGANHLFTMVTGEDAKGLGAKTGKTKLWGLVEWDRAADNSYSGDVAEADVPAQGEFLEEPEEYDRAPLPDDGIPF